MNSKKRGKLVGVLLVALLAYGFGSCISMFTSDSISLEVPEVLAVDQQQISTIGDPGFEPVWLKKHVIINITNNTTNITNNTNRSIKNITRTNSVNG